MDIPGNHVESNKADQPKNQQNQKNCPKHVLFLPSVKSCYAVLWCVCTELGCRIITNQSLGHECGSPSRESQALSATKPHYRWSRRQPLFPVRTRQRCSSWWRVARPVPRSFPLRTLSPVL